MLFHFGLFVSLASIVSVANCLASNCTENSTNSLCLTPDPVCQRGFVGGMYDSGLTDPTVIEYIVSMHNIRRAKIASGGETRSLAGKGPQKSTGCMSALKWETKLATSAQNWANQCLFKLAPDRNLNVTDDPYVGQLAYGYIDPPSLNSNGSINQQLYYWDQAIQSWYDSEITKFDPATVSNYTANPPTVHLTQFIWGRSSKIGCGFRQWVIPGGGGRVARILVCNYWPGGNIVGKPVYVPLTSRYVCQPDCTAPDKFYNTDRAGFLCH